MDNIRLAELLTEAALLLNDDCETLNEGVSDTLAACAIIIGALGLGTYSIVKDVRKQKQAEKNKQEEEYNRQKQEDENKNKELKIYIDTISKKELKISSKEELMKSIFSDIKTIVSTMKKDKKYYSTVKENAKKVLDEGYEDDWFDGLICRQFDEKCEYEIIEIIDGSQTVRSSLWYVLNDIKYIIKKKYAQPIKDFNLKISTGDGDEGCFYMD